MCPPIAIACRLNNIGKADSQGLREQITLLGGCSSVGQGSGAFFQLFFDWCCVQQICLYANAYAEAMKDQKPRNA
ncbi:hypothetical protein RRG08_018518 [Elysia crispata]|uniref:Uncharacterized protein n=1 Tax=Elysia crispata TaxID=231223 RepID=A0AAE0YDU7_9GAST|nr:hypothetical protein RRG08_018518 [Elysia crispata]